MRRIHTAYVRIVGNVVAMVTHAISRASVGVVLSVLVVIDVSVTFVEGYFRIVVVVVAEWVASFTRKERSLTIDH